MSFSGDRFLVNEKTLELNITHELMASMNAGAIGFAQGQEKVLGADASLWPVGNPLVLQYKRPRKEESFGIGVFRINTNGTRNHPPTQHAALDVLSRHSNLCDVYYVFPLVYYNQELVRSFGRLSDESVYIPPSRLTDSVRTRPSKWMDEPHTVKVASPPSCHFQVESKEKGVGYGFSKKELLEKVSRKLDSGKNRGAEDYGSSDLLTTHIEETVKRMETVLKEAKIRPSTEHTMNFFFRSKRHNSLRYAQLTVRLKGTRKARAPED